jgi:hypothetical protein
VRQACILIDGDAVVGCTDRYVYSKCCIVIAFMATDSNRESHMVGCMDMGTDVLEGY